MAKTLADQIKDLENTRAAKMARLDDLTKKSLDGGRSFEADEAEEFDTLESEIKQIDEDHARYTKLMKMQMQSAAPVDQTQHQQRTDEKHSAPMIITKKADPDDKFEGQSFTRSVIAKALARETGVSPIAIAENRWGKSHPT
jgi:hypothetical protein